MAGRGFKFTILAVLILSAAILMMVFFPIKDVRLSPAPCDADVNDDGNVDLIDAEQVKSMAGCDIIFEECAKNDVNGDLKVNSLDAVLVKRMDGQVCAE